MTIRISLGNVGSGKTANEVREMVLNRTKRITFSNIIMKQPKITPHVKRLTFDKIITKQVVDTKKDRKTGEEKPIYELALNLDFWKKNKDPLNIVLDEAHSILNSRRSMSKTNILMTDWVALIRRVLGSTDAGYGEFVLITQLPYRIDNICRDMAQEIRYHICSYQKMCLVCGGNWVETSESPEHFFCCLICGDERVKRQHFQIHIWHFTDFNSYWEWKDNGKPTYYKAYSVTNIEKYFGLYDTLQWDNLLSETY